MSTLLQFTRDFLHTLLSYHLLHLYEHPLTQTIVVREKKTEKCLWLVNLNSPWSNVSPFLLLHPQCHNLGNDCDLEKW